MIFVKSIDGRTLCIYDVDETTTIRWVKDLIAVQTHIPADLQRLIHAGRMMRDDDLLGTCGIARESTLHMSLPLRGC